MAKKLGIEIEEIPRFLEDYGDIFLSLSYFRNCLDQIEPIITEVLQNLIELRTNYQLKHDPNFITTSKVIQTTINALMAAITGRFENFERSSQDMWNNLDANRFQQVKKLINAYHTTIGGVLCGLTVIMDAWAERFPSSDIGGPIKRSEFILAEMKQGMAKIKKVEDQAPMLSQIQ